MYYCWYFTKIYVMYYSWYCTKFWCIIRADNWWSSVKSAVDGEWSSRWFRIIPFWIHNKMDSIILIINHVILSFIPNYSDKNKMIPDHIHDVLCFSFSVFIAKAGWEKKNYHLKTRTVDVKFQHDKLYFCMF